MHLTLDVERMGYGVDAVARHEGQVVFVPYAVPGDRVVAEVVERRRDWLRARALEVERPGPDRVLPGCAAFPVCGGCQWQQLAPDAQRRAKQAIVAEHLRRGARVAVEVPLPLATPADWRYRARITLVAEGRRLGYHRARSHTLVDVDDCPIADAVVAAHLDTARAWVEGLRAPVTRVTIAAAAGGVVLVAALLRAPGPVDVAATERALATHASVRGAVLAGGGTRAVVGDPTVRVELEPGCAIEAPADVFTQVNPTANRLLVATVLGLHDWGADVRVLDLYAGAGNFSLPIARRGARVTGIERDAAAVAAATASARRLGLADRATFRAADVAAALATAGAETADVVILDPPRAGAAPILGALAALRARTLIYVSCDPTTLGRDVGVLVGHGYRVARVQPVDMFPQTFHVETVAELVLT